MQTRVYLAGQNNLLVSPAAGLMHGRVQTAAACIAGFAADAEAKMRDAGAQKQGWQQVQQHGAF